MKHLRTVSLDKWVFLEYYYIDVHLFPQVLAVIGNHR